MIFSNTLALAVSWREAAVALDQIEWFSTRLCHIELDGLTVPCSWARFIANVFPLLCSSHDTGTISWLNDNVLATLPEGVFEGLSALTFL